MAKKDKTLPTSTSFTPTNTSSSATRRFDKDLQKDISDYHLPENEWTYARNAINNSNIGDLGRLGNEPANKNCITAPYTIIGFIHLREDRWAVFSTDNSNSEIGYFEENKCVYSKIVNDPCLGFSTEQLIYGLSREDAECNTVLYWADGLNVDRFLKIGDLSNAPYQDPWPGVPYACQQVRLQGSDCYVCEPFIPYYLNCDKIRLETLMKPICFHISKDASGGELLNGSYFVTGAYTVDGQRVTDYFTPSEVQPLFDHSGTGGSLNIEIVDIDTQNFDEFELVIVSVIAQQTVAKRLGIYSTRLTSVTIDILDPRLVTVPIEQIPVSNVIYEKSDAMYEINDYLLRVGPTSKFEFNYQPLANQIRSKWHSVEYPETYYQEGGNNTGYMRDEVYSFFIRWVYNTGDRSASFHIPGRPMFRANGPYNPNQPEFEIDSVGDIIRADVSSADTIETQLGINNPFLWQSVNTAQLLAGNFTPYNLCDGGIVVAEGYMGYWESTEKYPDNKPEIWNASYHEWSSLSPFACPPPPWPYDNTGVVDYDLCGRNIRHHRFPDNDLDPSVSHFRPASQDPASTSNSNNQIVNLSNPNLNHIRIMSVSFENIRPPMDNDGNLIPGIIGYEILRGSRTGNKSVIAKGMINNMVGYNLNIRDNSTVQGLYQNYPYNDLHPDFFLSKTETRTDGLNVSDPRNLNPVNDFKDTFFSFHSPETNFANPYLSSVELKLYQDIAGTATMRYQYAENHPKEVFLKDFAALLSVIAGIGIAVAATTGKKSRTAKQSAGASNILGTLFAIAGTSTGTNLAPHPLVAGAAAAAGTATGFYEGVKTTYDLAAGNLLSALLGQTVASNVSNPLNAAQKVLEAAALAAAAVSGTFTPNTETYEYGAVDNISYPLWIVSNGLNAITGGLPPFLYYATEGAELAWRSMYTFARPMNHALQMISHCFYNDYTSRIQGQRRRLINNQAYIDNQIHSFSTSYRINNLYRGRYVALEINAALNPPAVDDRTRVNTRLRDLPNVNFYSYKYPEQKFDRISSSYYAAIKQRLRNQYGQIENILQIPISCVIDICPPQSFNGRSTYSQPSGFDQRLPVGLLSNCTSNILQASDFANASDIGPSPAPWVSDAPSFWQTGVSGLQTVAINDGTLQNINGNTYLYQTFGGTPASPIVLQNGQPYTLSFDILDFPSQGYTLNIYLGQPSITSLIGTVTSTTVGNLPNSFSVPANSTTPAIGSFDRIVFESVGPRSPFVSGAIFKSENFSNTGAFYWNPALINVTNNAYTTFETDSYFSTGTGFNGNPLAPNWYTGTSRPKNFITNLNCPTQIQINFKANAQTAFPFAGQAYLNARLVRLYPGMPNGNIGQQIGPAIIPNYNLPFSGIYPIASNITIDIPNPVPSDRYCVLIETRNLTWAIEGFEITVNSCFSQEAISITNVCLQGNTQEAVAGCMDPLASNYNPDATLNCCCEYIGCTDPDASNFDPNANVPCTDCGGGVEQINCCCIPFGSGPGSGAYLEGGVGYCTHSCLPVTSGTGSCVGISTYNSYPLFGGDIYINRYTEKNSFFYFTDWLYGQPDRYEWDYLKYRNVAYPTYWYNSEALSITSIVQSWYRFLTTPTLWGPSGASTLEYPSKYHVLDRPDEQFGLAVKLGYIYLFNSGVRDFFVESEYNIDLRDYGEEATQRHYKAKGKDSYTDTSAMFSSLNVKSGNYYKYDTSLSIAKIWYSYVGWGSVYPRNYNPLVSETCYQYNPNRIIYSLQAIDEGFKDNWRIFLSNNYKDFISKVMVVKQINKSGAVILFESDSPVMFQGTDQLQTDLGTKLTIGDGGLFSQPMQSLMNADRNYEYGSCQNRLSVINTPVGTFWINQNQGKIFQLSSGLTEISMANLKWWLAQFLPYQLTKYYPDYKLADNPVAGIGCQTTYDNTNNLVYFTKKDYKPLLKQDGTPKAVYNPQNNAFYAFVGTLRLKVELTDTAYFEPASWTISYDVKTKSWVSFHDWHPDLTAPGKNTFMTSKNDGVWMHNQRCDLYVNYYGVNYPFEVEYMANTIQTVNTLRSVEYQLEVYKYKYDNCYDRFHVLDFNFDEAVIYNTEQCSGLLKLNLTPKNNAPLLTQYPQVNPTNIQILYSKEENKYRFNQFWDTTKDRGEFDWIVNNNSTPPVPGDISYPPDPTTPYPGGSAPGTFRQQTIWNTQANGYVRNLNSFNLNYNKSQLERKKFRHYTTSVLLRRKVSGNKKMLVSLTNNKNLLSPR